MKKETIKNIKRTISKTAVSVCMAAVLLLAGCEEKQAPELSALSIDSSGTTGAGISAGSTYEEFVEAYGAYQIQEVDGSGNFVPFEIEPAKKDEVHETEDTVLAVSGFFVDEEPVSTEELEEMTGCGIDELAGALSGSEFLSGHSVIYKYVIFTIKDNTVTEISGDYLDYNSEL